MGVSEAGEDVQRGTGTPVTPSELLRQSGNNRYERPERDECCHTDLERKRKCPFGYAVRRRAIGIRWVICSGCSLLWCVRGQHGSGVVPLRREFVGPRCLIL